MNISMDEENSDAHDKEECMTQRVKVDGFEENENDTGEDIEERAMGRKRKHRVYQEAHWEPCIGMEFESYVAAGKFYSFYARRMGFETKIRQSRSNRMVGKWYVQFSCNKEGFRRVKPNTAAHKNTDGPEMLEDRCGCLATMKVKLIDNNRWRVFKVNLAHNHRMDTSRASCGDSRKIVENSSRCGRDECMDPCSSMDGIKEYSDDMDGETSKLNTTDGENTYAEPTVGMEFESYLAAGQFYNSYAMLVGFETKIRQSRSNLRHGKRYVQFSCNREGFKREKTPRTAGIRRDRPDARCGCLATMKIKLTGQNKWRVFYVHLAHNHEVDPRMPVAYKPKSHKKQQNGVIRRLPISVAGPDTNNSSRTSAAELETHARFSCPEHNSVNFLDLCQPLELGDGGLEAMQIFFQRMQLKTSSFFYSLDLNSEGHVLNVFWVDSRSRAAYEFFGDVVTLDTTYLTNNYVLKLALFVGTNHHGQPVLLGCGLLSSESKESFEWLLRTWLLAMSDHSPYAIISDQIECIQEAVAEVFPHSHHRFCIWQIMKKVAAEIAGSTQYNEIIKAIKGVVCNSLRIDEFERDWCELIVKYDLHAKQLLKTLYRLRENWVPCFLKYGFWAGMSSPQNERLDLFFDDYVHPDTCLSVFFEQYELALNARLAEEAFTDYNNLKHLPSLDHPHWFEAQLANIYTKDIFKKFQQEVNGMVRCYDMSPVHVEDTGTTYVLKERLLDSDGRLLLPKEYQVFYNKVEVEVICICNLFQFEGFLCRHSLYILQNHGVVDIPSRYIIARWRKDYKHNRSVWYSSSNMVLNATAQWPDILHLKCRRILEESSVSERGYLAALQVLDDGLVKVRLENDAALGRNGQVSSNMNTDAPENDVHGNSTIFYSDPPERANEPNPTRLIHDSEKTSNSEKPNSYSGPFICDSCMADYILNNPAINSSKKRLDASTVSSDNNSDQLNENLVSLTTQDLLGSSANEQGFPQMAPCFDGPPTCPRYIPVRHPSTSVMLGNGFVHFSQVLTQSQDANKQ